FKVPQGQIVFDDLVHGRMVVDNSTLDDFIIVRSDGTPVYQLAVVVDDHDMDVNLVLRGDDHLSNTNKQILLYLAMNWKPPQFAHVPLILGPDKNRLSKRHGATSVEEFKERGILPEALFNYLCLLGWSPGTDQEIFSRAELIREFKVKRINKTAAVFDEQKLLWMNAKYLAEYDERSLLEMIRPLLSERGITEQNLRADERLLYLVKLQKIRSKTLTDLADGLLLYFKDPERYEEKGVRKFFLKETGLSLLNELYAFFKNQTPDFYDQVERIERELRQKAEEMNLKAGQLIQPLRLALTGSTASPGIFELIYVLGSKKVLNRLKNAINYVKKMNDLNA
ncbi:glutamate--tRNA ligase, partial [Caldithrix abyssi]